MVKRCYLAYVSNLLIIINLTNLILNCITYHNRFLTYKKGYRYCKCLSHTCVLEGYHACPVPRSNTPRVESGRTIKPK